MLQYSSSKIPEVDVAGLIWFSFQNQIGCMKNTLFVLLFFLHMTELTSHRPKQEKKLAYPIEKSRGRISYRAGWIQVLSQCYQNSPSLSCPFHVLLLLLCGLAVCLVSSLGALIFHYWETIPKKRVHLFPNSFSKIPEIDVAGLIWYSSPNQLLWPRR